jgi:CRISPR-associated endonuclease/helicase Cas3
MRIFEQLTGNAPYPWQAKAGAVDYSKPLAIALPTGAGKELGAVMPWLYGAIHNPTETPMRLLYVLPTRTLVDQVYSNIATMAEPLGFPVYCLMGGRIDAGWELNLSQRSIIVGTLDQLITRAVNRGYATSPTQMPLAAAAFNNDVRWVLDEIQLWGVGYPSAVQLHKLRCSFGCWGKSELVVMSATFDDRPLHQFIPDYSSIELSEADRQHSYLGAKLSHPKPCMVMEMPQYDAVRALAQVTQREHRSGTLTLVVCNRVKDAIGLSAALSVWAETNGVPILLLHSRFFGWRREELQRQLRGFQGMVIATQVVEAGVDLDADTLITVPCPWASFKQRAGRCGRNDMSKISRIIVVCSSTKEGYKPYEATECTWTVDILKGLPDVSLLVLDSVEAPLPPLHTIVLSEEHLERFFATVGGRIGDLVPASDLCRERNDRDCYVFYSDSPPDKRPHQRYLCSAPVGALRALQGGMVFRANRAGTAWQPLQGEPAPGELVWLPYNAGGYSDTLGFTGRPDDQPMPYPIDWAPRIGRFSGDKPVTLDMHSGDAREELESQREHLSQLMPPGLVDRLVEAARQHDWGKAAAIWQTYCGAIPGGYLAKGASYGNPKAMQGYRHDLGSALAVRAMGGEFLEQYLIAAHHGKIRYEIPEDTTPIPSEVSQLPGCVLGGIEHPAIELPSVPKRWRREVAELLEEWGSFRLWYLESLIRGADVRASIKRKV